MTDVGTPIYRPDTGSTAASDDEATPVDASAGKSKLGLGFWLPAGWMIAMVLLALFQPILPLDDPDVNDPCTPVVEARLNEANNTSLGAAEQAGATGSDARDFPGVDNPDACTTDSKVGALPSTRHWLGTDSSGRDNLARIIDGARVSMFIGLVPVSIGAMIGGLLGLTAGYFRGTWETAVTGLADIMLAFPALVLALGVVAILDRGLGTVSVAVLVVAIPAFTRITRANTLSYAERDFVTAARVMGASHRRIIFRELLPNVIFPVVAFGVVAVAIAVVAEASLAFLSLSVPPPQASWGQMITDGRADLQDAPTISLVPAAVLFLTVLSLNLIGDTFRRIFNVRDAAL